MAWWIFLVVFLVVLFLFLALFWWGLKKALWLAANSVVGFFALYAVQRLIPTLVINIWSVLLTALFGIFGLLAVLLLHLFGWAF